jgi:hypothetical protein|tara:strand:+ start:1181 stop:1441 length:261 start_codon:yes stop_codon:yes gene_type:complete
LLPSYNIEGKQIMKQTVNKNDIAALKKDGFDQELIEKLFNVKKERNYSFNQEQVRQNAIRVLGVMDKLTQSQRKRVLNFALKVNEV